MGIWSYKFSKLKFYVEGPKRIVDKYVVTNCSTSYKTGQKKASFHFHEDQELKRKWIYFVNRKDYYLTLIRSYVSYFEQKFVNSCAVANTSSTYNHNDSSSGPSLLRTPTISRKSPRKQNIWLDELILFQAADKIVDIDSISEKNSPGNFTFKRLDNSMQRFNLKCSEETGILGVHECISAERNLLVRSSYHGLVIPWWLYHFCNGFDMKITTPAVPLLNLVWLKTVSYLRND